MKRLVQLVTAVALTLMSAVAAAEMSIGINIGTSSADQDDLNLLITRANTREGGISTSSLGSALEVSGHWTYRFDGSMIALQIRPSYFFVSEDGSQASTQAAYEYSVTGFTIFPIMRFYLLENQFVKFFTQVGVGWGFANGEIKEDSAKVEFSGNQMGNLVGLGAEFCFVSGNHCMTIEGNLRYLPFERMVVDSTSGTFDTAGTPASINTPVVGQEIEVDNRDLSATFSGIMGVVGYTFYF